MQRDDDREETIRRRLEVYHSQTEPLIAYYDDAGLLRRFDGRRDRRRGPRAHPRDRRHAAPRGGASDAAAGPAGAAQLSSVGDHQEVAAGDREDGARGGDPRCATLDQLERRIVAGVSTAELDKLAERFIRSHGATPTFKGYRGFPGSICASPNAMIVHGIPGPYRLEAGDVISIDVGVTLDGWVADAARTFPVGEVGAERAEPARGDRGVAARRRRAVPRRQPHRRRLQRDPARRRGGRPVGRALARRPRRRAQHARGPAGAQLRQARQGAAAAGGHGPGDRADDDRRARRPCASAATAGRSSPRTARRPRTSSSRSRSRPTARWS